jgi:hypothetical protein
MVRGKRATKVTRERRGILEQLGPPVLLVLLVLLGQLVLLGKTEKMDSAMVIF